MCSLPKEYRKGNIAASFMTQAHTSVSPNVETVRGDGGISIDERFGLPARERAGNPNLPLRTRQELKTQI